METTSNKLSDRLKDMLLETGSTNVAKDSTSRPLIQVIDDKKDVEKKMTTNDTESDDELPPDIFPTAAANTTDIPLDNKDQSTKSTDIKNSNNTTDPARQLYEKVQQSKTLTEQMLAEANSTNTDYFFSRACSGQDAGTRSIVYL